MNLNPQQQIERLKEIQKMLQSRDDGMVLIVEDDASDSELVKLALAKHGIESISVSGVERAVLAMQGRKTALIFMDWKLVGKSGLEAMLALKSACQKCLIVVLSGVATDDDVSKAMSNGAAAVIAKPLTDEAIKLIFGTTL